MRKVILILVTFFICKSSFSQLRIGVGAGGGIIFLDNGKSYYHTPITEFNEHFFQQTGNDADSIWGNYSLSWRVIFELPITYQIKRNFIFFTPRTFFGQVKLNNHYLVEINSVFYDWISHANNNKSGIQIPISYGYNLLKHTESIALLPFLGISNNFTWTVSSNENWNPIVAYNGSNSQTYRIPTTHRGSSTMLYSLSISAGIRVMYKQFYANLYYSVRVFTINYTFRDTPLFHSINLTMGYEIPFKKKEKTKG